MILSSTQDYGKKLNGFATRPIV